MSKRIRTLPHNPRTVLTKQKMPKWIWQLRERGFHHRIKRYLLFLWRQRPKGCNWSRALRARYFKPCSIATITRWDALLSKMHLVWITGQYTLFHRIGARPYYKKEVWLLKRFGSPGFVERRTNAPPYTAQHNNCYTTNSYYAKSAPASPSPISKDAAKDLPGSSPDASKNRLHSLPQGSAPNPASPTGSTGNRLTKTSLEETDDERVQLLLQASVELDPEALKDFEVQYWKHIDKGDIHRQAVYLANLDALATQRSRTSK